MLQQQWRNAGIGERLVVLGAVVVALSWLIGVVVNSLWWEVAGAQTPGLLVVTAALVALVCVYFNGASEGKLPAHYGVGLMLLGVIMAVFVGLTAWSVFTLNNTVTTFSACTRHDANACAKIDNMQVRDQLNEILLTADARDVARQTVPDGQQPLQDIVNYSNTHRGVPLMPVSVWIGTIGLMLGTVLLLWGGFSQWTREKAGTV